MAKLTNEDVVEIKRLYEVGDVSQIKLASKFSVSQSMISHILVGRNWKSAVIQ